MKPEDLRSLLSSATPAPWKSSGGDYPDIMGPGEFEYLVDNTDGVGPEDAAMIVALRNLAPLLVDLWERAEQVRQAFYVPGYPLGLVATVGNMTTTLDAIREARP